MSLKGILVELLRQTLLVAAPYHCLLRSEGSHSPAQYYENIVWVIVETTKSLDPIFGLSNWELGAIYAAVCFI